MCQHPVFYHLCQDFNHFGPEREKERAATSCLFLQPHGNSRPKDGKSQGVQSPGLLGVRADLSPALPEVCVDAEGGVCLSHLQRGRTEPSAELLWTHLLLPLPPGTAVGAHTRTHTQSTRGAFTVAQISLCLCFRECSSPSNPVCPVDGAVIPPAEVRTNTHTSPPQTMPE